MCGLGVCGIWMSSSLRQGPLPRVLYMLELSEALLRDPMEERVAVVQSGGDKGEDQLFGIRQRECGAERF